MNSQNSMLPNEQDEDNFRSAQASPRSSFKDNTIQVIKTHTHIHIRIRNLKHETHEYDLKKDGLEAAKDVAGEQALHRPIQIEEGEQERGEAPPDGPTPRGPFPHSAGCSHCRDQQQHEQGRDGLPLPTRAGGGEVEPRHGERALLCCSARDQRLC